LAILVIDTCLNACQVGVFEGGRRLAGASEGMERGHQERLAPMAAEVMARTGLAFAELAKIVVTIGPGSFTGLRVGIAFAKGLSLATGAPMAGVGTLEALAASVVGDGPAAAVIDARRGQVYVQAFDAGRAVTEPAILPLAEAERRLSQLPGWPFVIAGPGAGQMADAVGAARVAEIAAPDLDALGALADRAEPATDIRPLYLRAPDARPTAPPTASR